MIYDVIFFGLNDRKEDRNWLQGLEFISFQNETRRSLLIPSLKQTSMTALAACEHWSTYIRNIQDDSSPITSPRMVFHVFPFARRSKNADEDASDASAPSPESWHQEYDAILHHWTDALIFECSVQWSGSGEARESTCSVFESQERWGRCRSGIGLVLGGQSHPATARFWSKCSFRVSNLQWVCSTKCNLSSFHNGISMEALIGKSIYKWRIFHCNAWEIGGG